MDATDPLYTEEEMSSKLFVLAVVIITIALAIFLLKFLFGIAAAIIPFAIGFGVCWIYKSVQNGFKEFEKNSANREATR